MIFALTQSSHVGSWGGVACDVTESLPDNGCIGHLRRCSIARTCRKVETVSGTYRCTQASLPLMMARGPLCADASLTLK
jgi:hypothetical protein